jgi:hypothetical protein
LDLAAFLVETTTGDIYPLFAGWFEGTVSAKKREDIYRQQDQSTPTYRWEDALRNHRRNK